MSEKYSKTLDNSHEEEVPMFAISNEELAQKPKLDKTVKCRQCGKRHRWKTMGPFHVYRCGGELYLCGIDGKAVLE